MHLRQAMLVNGLLFNSESWHNVIEADVKGIEKIYEMFLRFLLGSHSKAPLDLPLKGAIPSRFILSSRRMNYLQTILKREDEVLTKRVLKAQLEDTLEGDFANMVKTDFQVMEIPFDISFVETTSIDFFKSFIKKKIQKAALEYLIHKKHSK